LAYASTTRTTGCVDNTAPDTPATGIVTIASDNAGPNPTAVTCAVTEVTPTAENVHVAGVEFDPAYVKPENVATPLSAVATGNPPLPTWPADESTLTVIVEPVTVFPYASATRTTGCVARRPPNDPATGAVTSTNRDASPGPLGTSDPDTALVNEPDENVNW
jgi:hypothetical protein